MVCSQGRWGMTRLLAGLRSMLKAIPARGTMLILQMMPTTM